LHGGQHGARIRESVQPHAGVHEQHLGTHLHRQQLRDLGHGVIRLDGGTDGGHDLGRRALAEQQLAALVRDDERDGREQQPDDHGRHAIGVAQSRELIQRDPRAGHDDAEQRGEVLEEHREHRGILAALDASPPRRDAAVRTPRGRARREAAYRDGERGAFEDCGQPEHRIRPAKVVDFAGAQQVRDAFVDRQAAADSEQHHGDDQAPEVQFLAMPERVRDVGPAPAAAQSDEQQALVERVDERVERLGQDRGAAADRSDDELGRGERAVRGDGGQHHAPGLRFVFHPGRSSRAGARLRTGRRADAGRDIARRPVRAR